jgi:hypothetical protein
MNLLKKLVSITQITPATINMPFVFSYEECVKHVNRYGRICSHTFHVDEKEYVFFNNNHMFGYDKENNTQVLDTVPTSSGFPKQVVARKGLEDGIVCTFDHELFIHYQKAQVIYSLDELLDIKGCKANGEPKTV